MALMATFPKGHSGKETLVRKINIGSTAQTSPGKVVWWMRDPSDAQTLRGIPAVGRNVGGAIAGTRPDQAVVRVDDQAA